jgi:hypothetical protein
MSKRKLKPWMRVEQVFIWSGAIAVYHPMAAAIAIGMDEDLSRPLVAGGASWIVETLAMYPHTLNARSMERISEVDCGGFRRA